MGRKCNEVKSLYGSTIEDLKFIADNTKSNYTRVMCTSRDSTL
jgi:hypothetical protein